MRSPAGRRAGILLAAVLALAGCGDDGSAAALDAFRALAADPAMTYRLAGQIRMDGEVTTIDAVIAGQDALSRSGGEFEIVYKGAFVYHRFDGEWSRSPREAGGQSGDITILLPTIAAASLEPRGRVEADGRSLHRIVNSGPFELGSSGGLGATKVVAMDLLVDDEGRPVRAVLQIELALSGVPQPSGARTVVDLTFSDVGAPLVVETPSVRPGDQPAP